MTHEPSNKTEKELLDEAMEKWPEELELIAEEANKNNPITTEEINSIEEFREYFKNMHSVG